MKNTLWLFCFCLSCFDLSGHEQIVHQAITANAAAVANNSPSFAGFINVISSDRSLKQETNWMVIGSFDEDFDRNQDPVGGYRSYNHFYDPLDTTYGKGLSDVPIFGRRLVGNNSFVWGSVFDCPGINFPGVFWIGRNVNTMNVYSWKNARNYEWL